MADFVDTDLGSYLRRMRERRRPEEVGLVSRGPRRVPGLRREEVAARAGVSATYYTRLEQSQPAHASPSILRSIARALELGPDDEAYLLKIGTPPDHRQGRPGGSRGISPYTRTLVHSLGNAAVAVVNHRCDILAWNRLYHQIFAPHLDPAAPDSPVTRPNIVRMNFLDPEVRRIYVDWAGESLNNVSYLRFVAADHRQDGLLAELVEELTAKSEEFARLWFSQSVANCSNGTKVLEHRVVGRLELMYESADLRDGNVIKFFHAEPGTPQDAALELLAAEPRPTGPSGSQVAGTVVGDGADRRPGGGAGPIPPPSVDLPHVVGVPHLQEPGAR